MTTLLLLYEMLQQQKDQQNEERVAALLEVVQRSMHGVNERESTRRKPQWLIKVRAIVEFIVAPDRLSWVDDGISMSRNQYAIRALTEIGNRNKKSVDLLTDCYLLIMTL